MKRLLKSVSGGVTIVVMLSVVLSELLSTHPELRGSTDGRVEDNFSPAWLLYWTDLFIAHNRMVQIVCHIFAYSLLIYVFLWWKDKQKPLR